MVLLVVIDGIAVFCRHSDSFETFTEIYSQISFDERKDSNIASDLASFTCELSEKKK